MEKITNVSGLKEKILYLEQLKKTQEQDLKQEFKLAHAAFKPANLLKHTVKDLFQSTGFRESAVDATLALLSGGMSKSVLINLLKRPLKKLAGATLHAFSKKQDAPADESLKSSILHSIREFLTDQKTP